MDAGIIQNCVEQHQYVAEYALCMVSAYTTLFRLVLYTTCTHVYRLYYRKQYIHYIVWQTDWLGTVQCVIIQQYHQQFLYTILLV